MKNIMKYWVILSKRFKTVVTYSDDKAIQYSDGKVVSYNS